MRNQKTVGGRLFCHSYKSNKMVMACKLTVPQVKCVKFLYGAYYLEICLSGMVEWTINLCTESEGIFWKAQLRSTRCFKKGF